MESLQAKPKYVGQKVSWEHGEAEGWNPPKIQKTPPNPKNSKQKQKTHKKHQKPKNKIDTAIKICETSTPNEKPIKATKSTPSENDIWLKKLAKPKPWIKPKNSAIRIVK